jgi:hypothetical protein
MNSPSPIPSRLAPRVSPSRAAHGCALALSLIVAALALPAQAQTWEYKSYRKQGQGGQYNKDVFILGTITVQEKDGKPYFTMDAGPLDGCLRGGVPAKVDKTAETTVVEPQITLSGCEKFRYVIRNDGSGGHREVWRGEQWVNTKWDHGLTPAK